MTPDPGFKVTVVLKGEYLQSDAFYRHNYYIGRNRTPINTLSIGKLAIQLQPHCSYVNRANFSQASRGFVSDSWAFLFLLCYPVYSAPWRCYVLVTVGTNNGSVI